MRFPLTLALCALFAFAGAQDNVRSTKEIALKQLLEKGVDAEDLVDLIQQDQYFSHQGKVKHTFLRQRFQGIEIFNADIAIHQLQDGSILHMTQRVERGLSERVNSTSPGLSPEAALTLVLSKESGYDFSIPSKVDEDATRKQFVYDGTQFSNESVKVQLMLQPTDDQVILVWEVSYYLPDGSHWWNVRVDASTGKEIARNDWVVECAFPDHDHSSHEHGELGLGAPAPVAAPNDYNVFAWPVESPSHGARTLQNAPWNDAPAASPFGWHDTDGAAGAEFTITRGNNVHAQEDRDGNNGTGYSPDGTADLDFDYVIDFAQEPIVYEDAAITNLFYWNNIIHDVLYVYGFDEASGNFQENNYGNGGAGTDYVFADAQDGSGSNNANFGTPSDGSNPRMQMFLWTAPTPDVDGDLDNGIIVHEYGHGVSNRLVGGPSNTGCLGNAEQMGEGWSDYFSLMFTIEPGDTRTDPRGIGTYALDQPTSGPGIRPSPYSTDFAVNSFTYGNTNSGVSQPHGIGFVWCTALWELTWDLIDVYGYDADLYNGTGGNNIALQLVIDGLKLTACQPGFVDGRDAILQADQLNNGGANFNLIWGAFARRGLGYSADQGLSTSRSDQTEAFDLPVDINMAVLNITAPSAGVLLECNNAPFNVTIEVGNAGLLDQTNIPLVYQIDGGALVQETLIGTIISGASSVYSFAPLESITTPGLHTVKAWTAFPADAYALDDTLVIQVNLIPNNASGFPLIEDFEGEALCATTTDCGATICPLAGNWFNSGNGVEDDVDWRVNSGATGSTGTGPIMDFDPATSAGRYVYLETSGTCASQTAYLNSPCIDVSSLTIPTLSFAYHMYGATMGSLHVDVFDGAAWVLDVITPISGDQGNAWFKTNVDLTPFNTAVINIRLRGVTGSSFTSDMALDAIQIFDAAAPPIVQFNSSEDIVCGNAAVTFTDLSQLAPVSWNWSFTPNTVSFVNSTSATSQNPEVVFNAIGVYDVELTASNAYGSNNLVKGALIEATGGTPTPYFLDFETETACGTSADCGTEVCALTGAWTNKENGVDDDVDWRVDAGGTPSTGTGPGVDFIPGTAVGQYVYLEASGTCNAQEAYLVSECFDISSLTAPTLSYAYHMFGSNMGELHIDLFDGSNWILDIVPAITGDQGNQWVLKDASLAAWSANLINIRFRGITGSGFESDIALDAINVFDGAAPPSVDFIATPLVSCGNQIVTFEDKSMLSPTSWLWTITPSTFNYVNATSATSQHPEIEFTAPGNYSVTLDATNAYGTNGLTKASYLSSVSGAPLQLTVTTDQYPGEISWRLLDLAANVIASGGPYAAQGVQATEFICIPDSNCFVLEFNDSFGDGIFSPGGYVLQTAAGDTLVLGDGQYTTQQLDTFCFAKPLALDLRVMLGGPFDGAGLMNDQIRVASAIPGTEPYTALGYAHVGSGGESLDPSILTVTGASAIVDWVMVELRDKTDPTIVLKTVSALVNRSGNVVAPDGQALMIDFDADDYYVAVRHRNHLGCMTAATISLSNVLTALDLSLLSTATWGTDARQINNGVMVLWAGNVVSNELLKYVGTANDRDPILVRIGGSVATNVVTGYYVEDVNMDHQVKYTGTDNDRDPILVNIGGSVPTAVRTEQLP